MDSSELRARLQYLQDQKRLLLGKLAEMQSSESRMIADINSFNGAIDECNRYLNVILNREKSQALQVSSLGQYETPAATELKKEESLFPPKPNSLH